MSSSDDRHPSRPNRSRRHHYVPEMLQKHFAGPDRHLWFFDKREAEFGVRRRPIKRLLVDWHLYTTVAPDGSRDAGTETLLSKIETKAEPIFDRVVHRARRGESPSLTADERQHVCKFFIAQLRRSPDHFAAALRNFDVSSKAATYLAELEAAFGESIPADIRAEVLSERSLSRMTSNMLAGDAAEPMFRSLESMMARGFVAALVAVPNRSFILGSNPIVRLRGASGRNGLFDPTAEIWLPIAPDVGLFSYGTTDVDRLIHVTSDRFVRSFNVTLAAQSTTIVSASRDLIRSLSRRYLPEERSHGRSAEIGRSRRR